MLFLIAVVYAEKAQGSEDEAGDALRSSKIGGNAVMARLEKVSHYASLILLLVGFGLLFSHFYSRYFFPGYAYCHTLGAMWDPSEHRRILGGNHVCERLLGQEDPAPNGAEKEKADTSCMPVEPLSTDELCDNLWFFQIDREGPFSRSVQEPRRECTVQFRHGKTVKYNGKDWHF